MARRPDLEIFAAKHGIKMGTIADLIQYRMLNEQTVERVENTKNPHCLMVNSPCIATKNRAAQIPMSP